MKTVITLCLLCLVVTLHAKFPEDFSEPLHTIAFGSCNDQKMPQPLWPVIAETDPDLWIWMGDNIYADTDDMAVMKAKYDKQKAEPGYADFAEDTPIVGTWDDHDYGQNNAGSWYAKKAESQQLALDFMDVPPDDPRRTREGIYGSYTFGPEGKQVKVLLIDDRYHADKPGPRANLLGEAQWQWLQEELLASKAQLNLIVSGIQVLPEQHKYEKWSNFAKTRQALLYFILEKEIPGVVFLSGDRHIHEISVKSDSETPYALVDITSSGMTHVWRNFPGEPNYYRHGPGHDELGFGLMTIDWDAEPATVTFQIRDAENKVANQLTLTLDSLQSHLAK